ncbi:MAG: DUF1002 domain-containing protein [Dorea sp.]|jgi:uncharacterized protein YpuA (DUF1002 family)|nr:DUF1002 domain-containing protein [Dorea sp.]
MKNMRKIIPVIMAATLICTSLPMAAQADGAKVVTIGANLTDEQKKSMYNYFGTTPEAVNTIEVTNTDERKYMEGIASEAQIGTQTYSCSYVEPTTSGGIQVKVGNLTFVTSSMIASTLLTSGVENCNVVAASPFEVSGTGALTGIMMAYEKASGETLSEEQKSAATEELVTTGALADAIGKEDAEKLMNEVKKEVIENDLTDADKIKDAITDAAKDSNITLTEEQMAQINALMKNISQYDYDVNSLKQTLENLEGKVNDSGFFQNLWTSVKNFFTGGSNSGDGGIINDTKDEVLGENAVIDSTLEASGNDSETDEDEGGFWDKVTGFFKNLFGGNDKDEDESKEDSETEDNSEKDIENDSEASDGTEQPVDTAGSLDSEGTDNETAPADEGALNASDNPPNAEFPNNNGVDTANTDTEATDTNPNDNTGDAQ